MYYMLSAIFSKHLSRENRERRGESNSLSLSLWLFGAVFGAKKFTILTWCPLWTVVRGWESLHENTVSPLGMSIHPLVRGKMWQSNLSGVNEGQIFTAGPGSELLDC